MRTTEERRVRLCIDVPAELRRRLRYAALAKDLTLRKYLTALVKERLGDRTAGSDSGRKRG